MSKRQGAPVDAGDDLADDVHDEESGAEAALDAGTAGNAEPNAADPAEVPLLTNGQLAQVFHDIGDLLEVKGELVFKTVAYHRAADAIGRSPIEVARAYREGRPPEIAGIGKAIADKLRELALTGRSEYRDKLLAEFPTTLLEMLRLPGLGPKTVRAIYQGLGVKTVDELRVAAETGRVRTLRGLSERTEQLILEGIARLERREGRMLLHRARAIVEEIADGLLDVLDVDRIVSAGSYRRRKETIGDLDFLAETDTPKQVIETFVGLPSVEAVIGRGSHKAAVRLGGRGPQVDLMVMKPGEAGTYLLHFTGSKEHNVRLRAMARDQGWSLSEYGFARLGEDGEIITDVAAGGELRTFATEAEAYAVLGLPYIEPELREDAGEIEAALAGSLPALVTEADLRGDLHSHSDWSDGSQTVEVMAAFARRRGHAYQVMTDHTQSLAIARGLDPDRVALERALIKSINRRFEAEEQNGTAPPETSPEGFRLLHGCELEIRADGQLDYPDKLLAQFDLVVASLHVSRRQPRAELTQRVLNAIENPNVDVIAHPSGRMIQTRDDLDLDWEAVYAAAARTGTVLEMNGSPHRLDLSVERARKAISLGCIVSIDSDAHHTREFDHLAWGISQARRAWVEPKDVLNARSRAGLLAWLASPKPRDRAKLAPPAGESRPVRDEAR
ncbi:MAG TPA: DNA polymerase/3'-5' exonuclease PolX [Candidatus Limnocylindria bacterium]|nr:DNA polymerase/3'-5' exonuclease PolX [Candidatus Limnocylindria bacterium]